MAKQDFIFNGNSSGPVADRLLQANFQVGALRPYRGEKGNSYVTLNQGGEPTAVTINDTATLRKDDWVQLDEAIVKAAKPRLRAVGDLRSRNLEMNLTNGMGKTVLQTQTQSDITEADVSMDGLSESQGDRPQFDISNLPLPIIHKDFQFSAREIQVSQNGGSPLDTSSAELASRRVAEQAEKLLLGTASSYQFGGGTIYGYTNYPSALTKNVTDPSSSGWTGSTLLEEVLQMRKQSQDANHYGPWMLYCSSDWDVYMDEDYSANKGDNTVRERLEKINGVEEVRTVDYLENYDLCLVQMTSNVVREVIGLEITTVEWDSQGGMQKNFKVMGIMVPQLRSDQNGNTGIVYAST